MEPATCALGSSMLKLPGRLNELLKRHSHKLPKGAEDEIQLIKLDLEEIIAILSKFEEDRAAMIKCWTKEVRELSYDIEDFLDQYEYAAVGFQRGLPRRAIPRKIIRWHKTRRTPLLPEKLKQRLWMANKIREFSMRSQEALERYSMYNLCAAGTASARCIADDESFGSWHPTPGGDDVHVGIDVSLSKLEECLMTMHDTEQHKLKVVSIVGFGGVGKTTVANKLYHKLRHQFECRAFVRTSQKPDTRRIFSSLLSQVCPHQRPDNWKVHSLISRIRTYLQDKRYLIIIDDLWATSTWDIIKCALPDGNNHSRILITTEIENLALQCCGYDSKYVFKMKPLGEDDSRRLFFSSVFGVHRECPPELREVSNDIIRKCGGLPLAIVTIASVLANNTHVHEQWNYVNKSLDFCLMSNPTLEGMKRVLDIGYNNLPHHLKPCMLYISIYEEDNIIWKDDLLSQWIAEGFISATEGQEKQEISKAYFDELVGRKMIQPVQLNNNGEISSCVLHHMVLNFVAHRSIEENFVTAVHHSQVATTLADKVRRLSLHFGNEEDAMLPTNMRLSQVRTLAFFGEFKCMPSIVEFRLLQVLMLHFWVDNDSISLDLTSISELFRLRYLKVMSNATLELQTQMQGLQYLETLRIDARVSAVPLDIVYLRALQNLSLPAETNLPNEMVRMTSLRTLGYFDLSCNSMENVQKLSMLTNLRDLQLTCSTVQDHDNLNYKMVLLGSILGKLKNLKLLTLVPAGDFYGNSLDDFSATSTRHIISVDGFNIVSDSPLILQRFEFSPRVCLFSSLPKCIGEFQKLCSLKIAVRKISMEDVDVLKGMPALSFLSLHVYTKPVECIVIGKAGFPVLTHLKFKCCDPWLKFEADAVPNLRKLELGFNARRADQQSTVPIGIEHLPGLREVSFKIGGVEESNRVAAELAFRDVIKVYQSCLGVAIHCVNKIFGCKEDTNTTTREEGYSTHKEYSVFQETTASTVGELVKPRGETSLCQLDTEHTMIPGDIAWWRWRNEVLQHRTETCPLDAEPIMNPLDDLAWWPWQNEDSGSSYQEESIHTKQANNRKRKQGQPKTKQMVTGSPHSDGFSWRKYGQKEIHGAKHPRCYYRCAHKYEFDCKATKTVQRMEDDPNQYIVAYKEEHTCGQHAVSDGQGSGATERAVAEKPLLVPTMLPEADSMKASTTGSLTSHDAPAVSTLTSDKDTTWSRLRRKVATKTVQPTDPDPDLIDFVN